MVEYNARSAKQALHFVARMSLFILKPQTDHQRCPQEESKEIKLFFFFYPSPHNCDTANSLIYELNTINKPEQLILQTSLEMS